MALAGRIIPERLAQITSLDAGDHDDFNAGVCAMEAVAYIAGEPWSDHPSCACPVLGAFMRGWNDGLADDERTSLLLPLIPKLVGTKSTAAVEQKRAMMAMDWLIRVHTPACLRLAGLNAQAQALKSFPEITNFAQCPSLMPTLSAVRNDADAAKDAAWAASRASGGDAAWDAVRDAAWAASCEGAQPASWKAARAVVWEAARAAVWAAAKEVLAQTKATLQASAVKLVERMISVTE